MSKRLLVALAGLTAFAVQALEPPPIGDPQAGAEKAATCAACHGMDGNSPAAEWPKLAGQHADYGFRQTTLVRDGGREVLTMMPFVAGLSDQDIADIAAFYAGQQVMPGVADDSPIADQEETYAGLGRRLYQGGKAQAGVPSCSACHGPTGRGIPGAGYPTLAGQHAEYTAQRLRFFHQGGHYGDDRDASLVMVAVASKLNETEIDALATYIEGLHRPDPTLMAQARAAVTPAIDEAALDPAQTFDIEDVEAADELSDPVDPVDPPADDDAQDSGT